MSSTATSLVAEPSPQDRLGVLFDELAELTGQRNAIDGRVVQIVAEIDRDGLCGATGARSVSALVAWKTGMSPSNAETIATIAHRAQELPICTAGLREGRLSLDQVGVIAGRAGTGSDAHYAQLAQSATVTQLRTAIALEPPPPPVPAPAAEAEADAAGSSAGESEPAPRPEPGRTVSRTEGEDATTWKITLPHPEAATFDAALASHTDALIAQWRREHPDGGSEQTPPFPTTVDGFLSLIHAGWDTEVTARPHGQRTTVVVHLDLDERVGALHLGPLLTDADRRFLTCDATCEVWFERHGRVIGSGRATRTVNRRLRRVLEHRDRCCVVPGCGATRGLHAHHLRHWEDGGPTDPTNLALLCPYHHRLHHQGTITITGPADHLVVTDTDGRTLTNRSLARPPTTPPPTVAPCRGPTGERADWWWYDPYQPQPPPTTSN